jgi:CRISPR-associated protein Cmr2
VLALVPLDKAIRCAHALQKKFNKTMAGFGQDLGEKDRPSLSVGIAIGHFLEPLPVLLDLARRAEHLAKGDGEKNSRNALGIILKPRSGGEVEARSQWATDPAKRIDDWVRAFRDGSLPDRTPYLLREAAERLLTLDPSRKSELYKSVLKTSVQRIVQRRQVTGDNGEAARRMEEALRDQLVKAAAADAIGLRVLVGELLIARRIAAVMGQAKASSSDGNATTEGGER